MDDVTIDACLVLAQQWQVRYRPRVARIDEGVVRRAWNQQHIGIRHQAGDAAHVAFHGHRHIGITCHQRDRQRNTAQGACIQRHAQGWCDGNDGLDARITVGGA